MRDFWRRIRVFRRVSKVERCCLTAFPLATSAFVAAEMVAITDFWDSAIILRRAARSSRRTDASSGELLELSSVSLLSSEFSSTSVTESPSVTEESWPSVPSSPFLTALRIEPVFSSCSKLSSPSPILLSSSLTSSSVSSSRSASLPSSFTTCAFGPSSKLDDSPSSESVSSSSLPPSEELSPLPLRLCRLTSEP